LNLAAVYAARAIMAPLRLYEVQHSLRSMVVHRVQTVVLEAICDRLSCVGWLDVSDVAQGKRREAAGQEEIRLLLLRTSRDIREIQEGLEGLFDVGTNLSDVEL